MSERVIDGPGKLAGAACFCLCLFTTAAAAQDLSLYSGTALQYYTKNDDGPSKSDLNAYLELDYSGAYAGIWAEVTNWEDYNEVDLYLGYRGEAGRLSYDANYYYYIYPDVDDADYGELGLVLDYALTDTFSIGTELYTQPESGNGSAYLTAALAAGDRFGFDVSWGKNDEGFGTYAEWEIGGSYAISDEVSLGLRYYNGEAYDNYFRLELAWNTTLLTR
ncbi:hypothetical protein [Rhodobacter sp. 24-YEA-8]|uniref:hypothetical protein n=1 Tax=Rhodobacter sp. 24-YEA-8 TaxID=1884310 RepID=UPI0008942DC7|nr:hypothetical protein [Rhodobacter sp. 24-YEA-8]SEC81415.1 hypothetical protein SAMN05519105_3341 [Rhodobacter sp. 24-YEA-8]